MVIERVLNCERKLIPTPAVSFSVKQYPQINFGYLITQYTREFRTGYVEAAIDYFTLICLNADLGGNLGKSQASVCHEALREFILETRDFAKLLGDIRDDGTRIKGIIEQRLELINLSDQEDFLKNITLQAAGVADDKGLTTDAVLLYHLAENYDRVIDIINRALSDAIAIELGASMPKLQPLRPRVQEGQSGSVDPGSSLSLTSVEDPVELGKTMISLYDGKPMYYEKIRGINRDTCGLLLRMLTAKYEVEAGRWAPALDVGLLSFPLLTTCVLGTNIPRAVYQCPEHPSFADTRTDPADPQCRPIILVPAGDDLSKRRACHHVEHYLHWQRATPSNERPL